MLLDFILFWSVTLTALRLGMRGLITAEVAGIALFCIAVAIGIARRFGSSLFHDRARASKFVVSLALFSWSFSGGDCNAALLVAAMSATVPMALFGLYLMFRGPKR